MKKVLLISIMFGCSLFNTNGQITFQKIFRNGLCTSGSFVYQTNDGGYIMAGDCFTNGPVSLIKTDMNGWMTWNRSYYSSLERSEACASLLRDGDGGYVIAGYTSYFDIDQPDALLIKTDENGYLIWSKSYGGDSSEYIHSAYKTHDGGCIMIGSTNSYGAGQRDVLLIKTDFDGNFLWSKTYGGPNYENGKSIQQTKDRGYIIAGYAENPETDIEEGYLIKTDSSGNREWSKTYGQSENLSFNSVKQTGDGGYIIIGNGLEICLIKTDSSGALLWSKSFECYTTTHALLVQETPDNGYIIVGASIYYRQDMDAYLIKTDSLGNLLWSKLYGDGANEAAGSVWQTSDGGYILVGSAQSFGAYYRDLYLIKTDSIGYTGCYSYTPITEELIVSLEMANYETSTTSPDLVTASYALNEGTGGYYQINLCSTVGSEEVENINSFRLSPNPSTNAITITLPSITSKNDFSVTIYDVNAQQVIFRHLRESQIIVDVSHLPTGMYFVKISDGTTVKAGKFVKQ